MTETVEEPVDETIEAPEAEITEAPDADDSQEPEQEKKTEQPVEETAPEPKKDECTDCVEKYVEAIAAMKAEKDELNAIIDSISESLVVIDPNADDKAEERALIRQM